MAKKKQETGLYQTQYQPQGLTTGTTIPMPQSALINPEAQKLGLSPNTQVIDGKLKVIDVTPKVQSAPAPADDKKMYKGVDVSKSFSTSDFATLEDYKQAKLRAESFVEGGDYAQQVHEQELLARQMEQQKILSQLGAVGNISQAELNQLVEQYGLTGRHQLKEGAAGAFREALPGALQTGLMTGGGLAIAGAMGTGAAAGAVGGPVGIAVGAGAGILFGLWKGLNAAKKSEAKKDVSVAMAEFTQLKAGMTKVVSLAGAGIINEVEAVELYNAQLTRMLQIEAQIKYLQDTNLKEYLSDGSDELASVQSYLSNVAPTYAMRIRQSLLYPNSVPYSDVTIEDMENTE